MTGDRDAGALHPAPRPRRAAAVHRARRRLRARSRPRASRTSTRPPPTAPTSRATIEGNSDVHGAVRAGAGARHDRRPDRVADRQHARRDRRADEPAADRPPHARRGGARAHRAACAPAPSARVRRWPPRWPSSSPMDLAIAAIVALGLIAHGPARGGLARARRVARPRAGSCSPASARSRRQLTEGARAANGLAGVVLGVAFLAARGRGRRATGRCRGSRRSAWARATRPFDGERWWPLLLCLAAAAGARRAPRSRCSRGATSAPACCPTRPGPPQRRPARRRSAWRSGSSAAG